MTYEEAHKIFELPFMELLYKAHTLHRENFNPNSLQTSTLLSVKTGACTENCSYCAQSAHYNTGTKKESMLDKEQILKYAKAAKEKGSSRFCMGASGRSPRDKDLEVLCEVIGEVKDLGMETCVTLGLLNENQAQKLKDSGLDFYNHNIDTSKEYYSNVITTRTFEDRLNTIKNVRDAGLKICVGGILGLGESNEDRINMLVLLANLPTPPESIPINQLVRIPGTPLENGETLDCFDFVRIIALARILMPKSYIRLSAGRAQMDDSLQALCFFAGANSVFYGDRLLTTENATPTRDDMLFARLNLSKEVFVEAKA
ncbi:biotin synthase BioB [Helicobacter bilis]|uniref:Biotin synthase n=1 Tax=Helicobacter bilis TaxID=37372 RepID=A0A4U8UAJ7_9HELI|nr:biotin synthase BioB [Helicobacter bilis]MCI7410179.1 biotin synthase BioB [Helicobacter bilis]MDD7297495.1 biotin synthase BioB [Helicobacter bilis]MDY4399923.1 biotin synthase BioB [Helicobacter bilis]TLE09088.1 biotin synthase BioB [Helicobacter bilis]